MNRKTGIKEMKFGKTETIDVRRYATGEFMITSKYSFTDKDDINYISSEAFELMKQAEAEAKK